MKILFVIFVAMAIEAHALDAVITVLEAPVFKDKSYDAPVVQYFRKGDVIRIHPSVGNSREMDQYAPSKQKLEKYRNELKAKTDYTEDKLFQGEDKNTFYIEDEFIPTVDRAGNIAYVLSEHVFVYFNDAREFDQRIPRKDLTDYRLEEPLPRNYPLPTKNGYRGQFLLGIMQPNTESYPYNANATTKGYDSPVEGNITMLRMAPGKYEERLFIGGTANFRTYENNFTLSSARYTEERNYKFGLGPTISYDAFKGNDNRINLSGTILVNFYDRLDITQRSATATDTRSYQALSIAPRFNLQYHRKQVFPDLDFVLGTTFEVTPATTFRAKNAGSQRTWWQAVGDDKFTTRTTYTLGGYVGIQSAY